MNDHSEYAEHSEFIFHLQELKEMIDEAPEGANRVIVSSRYKPDEKLEGKKPQFEADVVARTGKSTGGGKIIPHKAEVYGCPYPPGCEQRFESLRGK